MRIARSLSVGLLAASFTLPSAIADSGTTTRPDDHAPLGVMGDHTHDRGEWMFSYRYMHMDMAGNRSGSSAISPATIATTVPNRFFGAPGQPPTLRVVPLKMTMEMHMFGAMYAPTDRITLMLMANYIHKEMEHVTFAGGMGDQELGRFETSSKGFGDTDVSALLRLWQNHTQSIHGHIGVSLPTGSITERDEILTPMGTRPSPRLPYPMQLGSGSYSGILGLTHNWSTASFSGGSQWRSLIRLEENDENYTLGDEHRLSTWAAWHVAPLVSISARIEGFSRGNIDGMDPRIMAPVQTADPDRQQVRRIDLGLGVNFAASGRADGHRLALEWLRPVYERLDGPQMETDWTLMLGWQYAL